MEDSIFTDKAAIEKALENSGFVMEYEVAQTLEKGGWTSIPNHEIRDPIEGKAREVDLFATKSIGDDERLMRLMVVAECKSGSNPFVVMTHPLNTNIGYPVNTIMQVGDSYPKEGENKYEIERKLLNNLKLSHIRNHIGIREYGSMCCKLVKENNKKNLEAKSGTSETIALAAKAHGAIDMYLRIHPPKRNEANLTVVLPLLIVRGDIYLCRGDVRDLEPTKWTLIRQHYITPTSNVDYWVICVRQDALEELFMKEIYRFANMTIQGFIPRYKTMKNIWSS